MRCQPRRRAHRRSRLVRPNLQRCFAALLLLSAVLLSQLPTTVARASQPGASEPEMVAGAAVEHDHGNAEAVVTATIFDFATVVQPPETTCFLRPFRQQLLALLAPHRFHLSIHKIFYGYRYKPTATKGRRLVGKLHLSFELSA